VRERDIEGVVRSLAAGAALYEQHPSCVHEPTSYLHELLMFIRAARSLSQTLKREDDDLRDLRAKGGSAAAVGAALGRKPGPCSPHSFLPGCTTSGEHAAVGPVTY
jgi:hypothetical protein